jgi:hypothetical protein
MNEDLAQFLQSRSLVRLALDLPGRESLQGYLLGLSETLGLIHRIDDFRPDGYAVFRVEDIHRTRSDASEKWFHDMYVSEGLLGGVDVVPEVDLTDMRSALETITKKYQYLIIESEPDDEQVGIIDYEDDEIDEGFDEDEEDDCLDFYIGEIENLAYDLVTFRHFDAVGIWEPEPKYILLDTIAFVQFDAPYVNICSKYLPNK